MAYGGEIKVFPEFYWVAPREWFGIDPFTFSIIPKHFRHSRHPLPFLFSEDITWYTLYITNKLYPGIVVFDSMEEQMEFYLKYL
jgi:hypothetical protein